VLCSSRFENKARADGFVRVAGLDEAGRGCLFGPVYAAAVILDPSRPIRGLNDSKQVEPSERERLFDLIQLRAIAWTVARAEAQEIDNINIYQASRLAMKRALESLTPQPDYLLVDALCLDTAIEQKSLIHGDARSRSIAAASIVAKVLRDRAMAEYEARYPGYGLAQHKGYATPEHRQRLAELGPTPEHRFSYMPVRIAAGLEPVQATLGFDSIEQKFEATCP
jgi:ribonuclease HII